MLSLDSLHRDCSKALRKASQELLENALPSAWSGGFGWQEHWQRAPNAGVYASCDGLLLLIELAGDRVPARQVFIQHLSPIFDLDAGPVSAILSDVRRESLSTTLKIAKYLQVATSLPGPLGPVAIELVDRLVAFRRERSEPGWPAVLAAREPSSVVATAEVAVAFAGLDMPAKSFAEEDVPFLHQLADDHASASGASIATWTLVRLWELGVAVDEERLSLQLRARSFPPAGAYEEIFFHNPVTGRGDYYHLDSSLLLAQAALIFARGHGVIENQLWSAASAAQRACKALMEFDPRAPEETLLFWQYTQSCQTLLTFMRLLDYKPELKDANSMHINPARFAARDVPTRADFAAVLMPFEPEWSEDVFAAFAAGAKTQGIELWRSDLEFGDDDIVQTIWTNILRSEFVIADCTGQNPNVFYELGIAHSVGKHVFMCAQSKDDFPFDVKAIRWFDYGGPMPSRLKKLSKRLSLFIKEIRTHDS